MQINPRDVIKNNIISNIQNLDEQLQQNGVDLTLKEKIKLEPLSFKNIEVNEKFDMKNSFGLIIIRSSLSRQGVFATSGVYDTGFNGTGGVSVYNMSKKTFVLEKGMRIAQMIVFRADAAQEYSGHYNNDKGIQSKLEV